MSIKISLSMIVKDEEKFLARCLDSVKELVDEMIVVDTGSTDKTKEIAKTMGAKVYDYTWKNNFADARNFSLSKVTGNWILVLDADEYFEKNEALLLKKAINSTKAQALYLQVKNLYDNATISQIHPTLRVFKKLTGLKWINPIHENITLAGNTLVSEITNISIIHSGYMKSVFKDKNKGERNKNLIEIGLKENPNDISLNFYMGNEYANTEPEKAIFYYERALKNIQHHNFESKIIGNYIRALIGAEKYEKCLDVIKESKKKFSDFTDLYFLEGNIYEVKGRVNDAKNTYLKCMQMGKPKNDYITTNGIGDIMPMEKLIRFAVNDRDWNLVLELFLKMIEINKFHEQVIYLFHVLSRMYESKELISLLEQLYEEKNPKELIMKYKIALFLRQENLLPSLNKKIGEGKIFASDFFALYLSKKYKEANELLLKQQEKTEQWYVFSLLLYKQYPDNILESELTKNTDSKFVVNIIKGKDIKDKFSGNDNMYLSLIEETFKVKDFDLFELLYQSIDRFQIETIKKTAYKLSEYFYDEKALELFDYCLKNEPKEKHSLLLKIAELYFGLGNYHSAIKFAEEAITEDNFRPYEIILESASKLGEMELIKQLSHSLIQYIPESNYLKNFKI